MMSTKTRQCCVRAQFNEHQNRAELKRLARIAARLEQAGRDASGILAQIKTTKASLAEAQQMLVEHEASHAGEVDE